jgi:hypothetical protein
MQSNVQYLDASHHTGLVPPASYHLYPPIKHVTEKFSEALTLYHDLRRTEFQLDLLTVGPSQGGPGQMYEWEPHGIARLEYGEPAAVGVHFIGVLGLG